MCAEFSIAGSLQCVQTAELFFSDLSEMSYGPISLLVITKQLDKLLIEALCHTNMTPKVNFFRNILGLYNKEIQREQC